MYTEGNIHLHCAIPHSAQLLSLLIRPVLKMLFLSSTLSLLPIWNDTWSLSSLFFDIWSVSSVLLIRTYLYLSLFRKSEALWEAALASCVVPEGGRPLSALSEGARAWGGDPAQATHQTGLVFLETPVLLSTCLLKGFLHWLPYPDLGHPTQDN